MSNVDLNPLLEQLSRLQQIESEYRVTLSVLALVTERLMKATGSDQVLIERHALANSPDLEAHRAGEAIVLRAAR